MPLRHVHNRRGRRGDREVQSPRGTSALMHSNIDDDSFLPERDEDVGDDLEGGEEGEHDPVHHPFHLKQKFSFSLFFQKLFFLQSELRDKTNLQKSLMT